MSEIKIGSIVRIKGQPGTLTVNDIDKKGKVKCLYVRCDADPYNAKIRYVREIDWTLLSKEVLEIVDDPYLTSKKSKKD